jgi:hypothetical protein
MKTTTSTEEVSSHPVEKGRCEPKKHRNSPVPENNRNGLDKKFLQIYGAGRKSRKRPTLVVGKKPYGKCQLIPFCELSFLNLCSIKILMRICSLFELDMIPYFDTHERAKAKGHEKYG